MIGYQWRGPVRNRELNEMHADGFSHPLLDDDWEAQLAGHSLGWVCARDGGDLVGFVNVAWDGGVHAFILDTLVATEARRHGIGTELVAVAAEHARAAGSCAAAGLTTSAGGLPAARITHSSSRSAEVS